MEIVAWGDSITYGQGDSEALGWPGRLQKELFKVEGYNNVYNRGICGDTTEDVLKRFDVEAESLDPEVIFIALGMNDCKFPNGGSQTKVSLEKYKENIQELISKAQKYTKQITLIGITEVKSEDVESSSTFTNESIYQFDDTLRAIAEQHGLPYINMRGVLDIETDLSDGLHPNAQGYDKMYKKLLDFI